MRTLLAFGDSLPLSHVIILMIVVAYASSHAVHYMHKRGWYWQTFLFFAALIGLLVWVIVEMGGK